MARITPIRITERDKKEYARLVRNTRAKIRRTQKNYGIDLSGEVELPKLEEFSTRKEFNEWKERVGSFTNRYNLRYQFVKNEYDVVASKSQLMKIERDTKRAQRIADEELKKVQDKPVFQGGKQFGTVGQRTLHMSTPDVTGIHRPSDFDFSKVRNQQRLEDLQESMEKRAYPEYYDWRKEQLKMNFMKMLEETFNSDADDVVDKLADIPPDDFYEMYLMYPSEFNFDIYYLDDDMDQEASGYLNELNKIDSYIDQYKSGKINTDLKGF